MGCGSATSICSREFRNSALPCLLQIIGRFIAGVMYSCIRARLCLARGNGCCSQSFPRQAFFRCQMVSLWLVPRGQPPEAPEGLVTCVPAQFVGTCGMQG